MSLTKTLRDQGYDLIEGPIRNHNLLQLWLKKPFNDVQIYYSHIDHAFTSKVDLNQVENIALNIDSTTKDEYRFNIGITLNLYQSCLICCAKFPFNASLLRPTIIWYVLNITNQHKKATKNNNNKNNIKFCIFVLSLL